MSPSRIDEAYQALGIVAGGLSHRPSCGGRIRRAANFTNKSAGIAGPIAAAKDAATSLSVRPLCVAGGAMGTPIAVCAAEIIRAAPVVGVIRSKAVAVGRERGSARRAASGIGESVGSQRHEISTGRVGAQKSVHLAGDKLPVRVGGRIALPAGVGRQFGQTCCIRAGGASQIAVVGAARQHEYPVPAGEATLDVITSPDIGLHCVPLQNWYVW
jgi:hypothetical protein